MITSLSLALAAASAPMPTGDAMQQAIASADARLFYAAFEGCDAPTLEEYMHPNFRMLHDLGGLVADSADAFIGQIAQSCADRAPGGPNAGYANRRLATPGTRILRPLADWGVLEEGAHSFFEKSGEEWVMTGGARYWHTWQWMPDEGRFRLLESLSVDHGAAAPYPPPPAQD